MNIAHFSDLHISLNNKRENLQKTEYLLGHALNNGAEHFIITGDISHNAQRSDFVAFRELLIKYDLLDSRKVSLVIGNHDIFGGVYLATDILTFPKRCKMTNYHKKQNVFCDVFRELFDHTLRKPSMDFFPFVKQLDDHILIGLNSNALYSRYKNPFCSNGGIAVDDFQFVLQQLQGLNLSGKKLIIMLHHQLFNTPVSGTSWIWRMIEKQTMKLHGKKRTLEFIHRTGAKLVLHGHTHYNQINKREGVTFVNAGGSVEAESATDISYFMIAEENANWKIEQQMLNPQTEILRFPERALHDYHSMLAR